MAKRQYVHVFPQLSFMLLVVLLLSVPRAAIAQSATATTLTTQTPGSATAPSSARHFSEFEQQVFQLVMADELPAAEVWLRLSQLQQLPQSQLPANRALLLMQQCRLARGDYHAERAIILQQLVALKQVQDDTSGVAAWFKCQQYEARLQRQDDRVFKLD